jgi:hypothetical protein
MSRVLSVSDEAMLQALRFLLRDFFFSWVFWHERHHHQSSGSTPPSKARGVDHTRPPQHLQSHARYAVCRGGEMEPAW